MYTYDEARDLAIKAAKAAIVEHYDKAHAELSKKGEFGKNLDRKARKLALKMGGFRLPDGWTIGMVTPDGWGSGGYRGNAAKNI